jgi:hypothetical protein
MTREFRYPKVVSLRPAPTIKPPPSPPKKGS